MAEAIVVRSGAKKKADDIVSRLVTGRVIKEISKY